MRTLHLVTTFPALTHTFVFRTIRYLKEKGVDVIIGELRPLYRTPTAEGFEDLNAIVDHAHWFSIETLKSVLYFCFCQPTRLFQCLKISLYFLEQPRYLANVFCILLSSMKLAYCLRRTQVDLVQADFLHTEALAARFCKSLMRLPYMLRVYTSFFHHPRKLILEIAREADAFVADTCEVEGFLKDLNIAPERIHLLRNGICLDEFPYRSRLGRDGTPIILAAGSLYPKKGFHVLLLACALLQESNIPFKCIIVGDGHEREALAELQAKLGLHACVEMVGYLSMTDLRDWYYQADVFIMPSVVSPIGEVDGLPTVLIEASATGLPVIGTQLAGIPELIQDNLNGFIVPPNAPEALAERIRTLLEDSSLRHRFGCEARRRIENEFDLRRNLTTLRELVLGMRTSPSAPELGGPVAISTR